MLETNKQKLIEFIKTEGKEEFTWADLAKKFNIKEGESIETRAKAANDIWRSYQKKQNKLIEDFHAKAKVSKIKEWQNAEGKWLKSIEYQNNSNPLDFKKELVKAIAEYELPKFKVEQPVYNRVCAILALHDIHFGNLALKSETGEDANLDKTIADFNKVFDELLSTSAFFQPELIVFPIGQDIFHANGPTGTTLKGTKLDISENHFDCFKKVLQVIREAIDKASTISKVFVPLVTGNHDTWSSTYLALSLEAIYKDHPNVEIDATRISRKYFKYYNNFVGMTHGDRTKTESLPIIMAAEKPKEWAESTERLWLTGHYHHQTTKDLVGCQVRGLRSIASTDEWHYSSGFIGVKKSGHLFILDAEQGLKLEFKSNV